MTNNEVKRGRLILEVAKIRQLQIDIPQLGSLRDLSRNRQRTLRTINSDKPALGIPRRHRQNVSARGRADFQNPKLRRQTFANSKQNAKGKQMLRVRFDERQCFVKIILARFVTGFARLHSARTLAEPHLRRKKLTSRLPVRAV